MTVDIIITTWNGLSYLKPCITSLYKHTAYPFHLIVVDNASTDDTASWLTAFNEKVSNLTVHVCEQPTASFSEANNVGLRYAKHPYVLLLNNDTLMIHKGWLHQLVDVMEQNGKAGIVGVKLIYPNGLIQHAGMSFGYDALSNSMRPYHIGRLFPRDRPEFNVQREVPAVTFACVLIRRSLLQDGLDEAYRKGCYEDTDFCMTIRKQGWKILYTPVEIYHYEGRTSLTIPHDEWYGQVQKNFQLFLSRWNNWLHMDFNKHNELYRPRGPMKPVL